MTDEAERPPDLGGRYRIVRLLGRGGMGSVYLARQTALDRDVALKVISLQEGAIPEKAAARFEQEMRATAKVEHPNTVRLYDSGATAQGLYLAMEYLPGRTLRELMNSLGGRLPDERAVRIAKQVAWALQAAHRERIVHRDLKPENIMVLDQFGEPDFVKVLDFGIARFLDVESARMTATGGVIGTPPYMSPEQALGRDVDEGTDLYALGVILYEMLSGRPPLVRDSAVATLMAQVNDPPPPIEVVAPDVTPALAGLVMALLDKQRARRPADAGAVAAALAAIVARPTGEARPDRVSAPREVRPSSKPSASTQVDDRRDAGARVVAPTPGGTSLLPSAAEAAGARRGQEPTAPPPEERPNRDVRSARGRGRVVARVLAIGVLFAGGAGAMKLIQTRQLQSAKQALAALARARHEPEPRDCPPCALADLRALVSLEGGHQPSPSVLTTLESVSPSCTERWTVAARTRLAAGDVAGARDDAGRAAALCPTFALPPHLLGNAAMKAGETDRAVAEWKRAVGLDARFAAPRFNLALVALSRKDAAAAISLLDQAIAGDPDAPNAYLLRGRARLTAGDHAAAATDLTEAVRRAPNDGEAWLLLGLAHDGHDEAAARAAFCQARELGRADAAARCPR